MPAATKLGDFFHDYYIGMITACGRGRNVSDFILAVSAIQR